MTDEIVKGDGAEPQAETGSHETLEGTIPSLATPAEREEALNKAFDYRGDVTLTLSDGRTVEGYIFDRRGRGEEACVRLISTGDDGRLTVKYSDITAVAFTGRDTAAGKSWETWVKNYKEKKARGEAANRYADPLE